MTWKYVQRGIALALGVTASMGTVACGGLGAGDYEVYRVAFSRQVLGQDCFDGDALPDSIREDSTTIRQGSTFVLYFDRDDTPLLDSGAWVLSGEGDGDEYSFSGNDTDVEFPPGIIVFDSDGDGLDDQNGEDPFVDADGDSLDDQLDDPEVDTDMDGLDDRFQDNLVDADGDGEDDRIVELEAGYKFITVEQINVDLTLDGDVVSGTVTSSTNSSCQGDGCPEDFGGTCTVTTNFDGVRVEDESASFGTGNSVPSSPSPTPGPGPGPGGPGNPGS